MENEKTSRQLNVILILTDQFRQDYTGLSRNSQFATPHLDALCGDHVFHRCTSVNPVCQPARTAMLTGRYSRQIGTTRMSGELSPDIPTFTQALQRGGYHTIGVGKFHYLQGWDWNTPKGRGHNLVQLRKLFHHWGFNDVWQVSGKSQVTRNYCDYAALLESHNILEAYRDDVVLRGKNINAAAKEDIDCSPFRFPADIYVDRVIGTKAIEHLDRRPRNKPFFAQISFCGPHPPYDPPEETLDKIPYVERDDFAGAGASLTAQQKKLQFRKRQAYRAMITEIDQQIGRLREYLESEGLLKNTVILFSTDHGEMLGDHALSQKSQAYWQSSRIPLYIRHPVFPARLDHDCLVESIDLTATILECCGLDPVSEMGRTWPAGQSEIPTRSLLPVLSGQCNSHRPYIFSECYNIWEMIETSEVKYIRYLPSTQDTEGSEILLDIEDETKPPGRIDTPRCLEKCRSRRLEIHDSFPVCQTNWTPYAF